MFRYTLLLLILTILFSCNPKTEVIEDSSQVDESALNETELNNADALNPQQIKSGIIYMKSTKPIHGSDIERTIYFDDYGNKRRVETVTVINAAGQRITTTQITLDVDGNSYSFNPEKKNGYITKINRNFNPTQIDFSKIDANTMQQFGIEKQGTEMIAGKPCTIYSIKYEAMNFNGLYSVWNNIPLREISRTLDFGYEYVAYKVEDNVNLNSSYFTIPNDIEFQESSGLQFP
jgi:hypothetical protein